MTHPTRPPRGFTLIEVMIVVVIIGILAAVAVPSYSSYLTRTRRTDATVFLIEAAGEQARYRSERNRYAADLAELGYENEVMRTVDGHYDVAVAADSASANKFELVATPVADGVQVADADCQELRITATGKRTPIDCW